MFVTLSPVVVLTRLRVDTRSLSPSMARVAVVGEVDLATAPMLRDRLLQVLCKQAPAVLVVDLAGVTFLDCTGVGALLAAHNTAVQVGCRMRIIHPRPIVRRVLDLTGVLGVLAEPFDQPAAAGSEEPPRTGLGYAVVAAQPGVMAAA